jgi:hypothetical protein
MLDAIAVTTEEKPMPLDDTRLDLAAYVPAPTPAYIDRWTPAKLGTVPRPRAITPRSDAQALAHIWKMLETKWARKYNDGDRHCIVGWVGETCSPSTVTDYNTPQIKRMLQRLHDALPRSAQRRQADHWYTLARYNDTHSLQTVRAWVFRAYLAEVNANIDKLNTPPDA